MVRAMIMPILFQLSLDKQLMCLNMFLLEIGESCINFGELIALLKQNAQNIKNYSI